MKSTGIIRRIDELGRIVIPKEIRKFLRIKEGDNLEIYTENEKIVLKKHSLIKDINEFLNSFAHSINMYTKNNIIITDTDKIIAISGSLKKDYLNKDLSEETSSLIKRRIEIIEKHKKPISVKENNEIEATYAISPIIVNGDSIGVVLILGIEEIVTESDFKIVKIASNFLKNHLEV